MSSLVIAYFLLGIAIICFFGAIYSFWKLKQLSQFGDYLRSEFMENKPVNITASYDNFAKSRPWDTNFKKMVQLND